MSFLERAQNGNGGSAFWRERNERIIHRARKVPITTDDILDIFEETCPKSAYTKAHNVLSRLQHTKKLKFVGGIPTGGKKRNAYATRQIRNLFHEWNVGQVWKAFGFPEIHTGSEVDRKLLPDAELFIGEYKYFLELDTGSMKRSQIEGRWKQYEDVEEPVLVVTLDEHRLRDLLRWSDIGCFTTLKKLQQSPFSKIWTTPEGEMKEIIPSVETSVEKPVNKSTTVTEEL